MFNKSSNFPKDTKRGPEFSAKKTACPFPLSPDFHPDSAPTQPAAVPLLFFCLDRLRSLRTAVWLHSPNDAAQEHLTNAEETALLKAFRTDSHFSGQSSLKPPTAKKCFKFYKNWDFLTLIMSFSVAKWKPSALSTSITEKFWTRAKYYEHPFKIMAALMGTWFLWVIVQQTSSRQIYVDVCFNENTKTQLSLSKNHFTFVPSDWKQRFQHKTRTKPGRFSTC